MKLEETGVKNRFLNCGKNTKRKVQVLDKAIK